MVITLYILNAQHISSKRYATLDNAVKAREQKRYKLVCVCD